MSAREEILGRVREALADVDRAEDPDDIAVPRTYDHAASDGLPDRTGESAMRSGTEGDVPRPTGDGERDRARTERELPAEGVLDLFAERVEEYRATVRRTPAERLPSAIADVLGRRGVARLLAPADIPDEWLADVGEVEVVRDDPPLPIDELDRTDGVLTGAAVGIAETGTVVLDAGSAQGRRALSLVPDRHLCVLRADQVVFSVPEAVSRLDPYKPTTFISGPSATSDIELDRVEGVHGPRVLDVLLVDR